MVKILGMVEHSMLPLYYSASDLVFVPYRLEQLNEGSVTIEAFACARPVVAFKRGLTTQTEQRGGFLVEDDPRVGGETLLRYLRRPAFLSEKGREAKALASEFSLETAGRTLENIYSRVLEAGDE